MGNAFIALVGFSCKNFSKLFQCAEKSQLLQNILEFGKGTSGDTFVAMINFILVKYPLFVLWENVTGLLEKQVHICQLVKAFKEAGYACADRLRSLLF